MTKLSLKELHEIEVTHSVISFCACATKETETCSKCGLEIYKTRKEKVDEYWRNKGRPDTKEELKDISELRNNLIN